MATYSLGNQGFSPLKHFPLADSLGELSSVMQNDESFVQSLDGFYMNMLTELEPSKRKKAYLQELNREIEAIFRINGAIAALLFKDKTVHCSNDTVNAVIDIIHGPVTVGRISLQLESAFPDQVSVDYFTTNKPSFRDYKTGTLFNQQDLEAGLRADLTPIDELMCEWLQLYQVWLEDYLYFNLAQLSKTPAAGVKTRIKNLSPLHNYLLANA